MKYRAISSASERVILLAFLCSLTPQIATANTIIFATGATQTGNLAPVNVEAIVTMAAGSLTVSLLNFQANPVDLTSLLSGVEFDFANLGSGTLTASIASTAQDAITLNHSGSPSYTPTASTWIAPTLANSTLGLCQICKTGNAPGGKQELIIGSPDSSGVYSGAGNNLVKPKYNPFILGSGETYASTSPLFGLNSTPTWVLNVPQITETTTITSVRFFFGPSYNAVNQEADATTTTIITPEPEPIFPALGGLLLIVASALVRKSTSKCAASRLQS